MIEVDGRPPIKARKETQFSTVKRRSGRESVPFLGLDSGEHIVRFNHNKGHVDCLIKVWLCPYGWAWKILNDI
jgi:hypothetical protein